MVSKITELRQILHSYPELSGREYNTRKIIEKFISEFNPDETIPIGNTSVAFVFNGKGKGKTILFRAELDALPIREESNLEYKSLNQGIAHLCGHDGHMAILYGLAGRFYEKCPDYGRLILLFQAAEETGQGAEEIINSPEFAGLNPDYCYALHNIPGIERGKVVYRPGSFSAASKGMSVKLLGKTSHAAEPENGINPAVALSKIIEKVNSLLQQTQLFTDMVLITIVHIKLGELAFGTNPGEGEIHFTLRSFTNADMELLTNSVEEIVNGTCEGGGLTYQITYSEIFPATNNNDECISYLTKAIEKSGLNGQLIERPFKWSEDFGWFAAKYKSCLFGIGAGTNHPALHHVNYDFPDDILTDAINLLELVYYEITNN